MPNQGRKEIIGRSEFSGILYHGGYMHTTDRDAIFPIDVTFPYRDHLISRYSGGHRPVLDRYGDYSQTLGTGLYTTTVDKEARRYAFLRGARHDKALLYVLDTPKANFFDFRNKDNPQVNGIISIDLAKEWQDYFLKNRALIENYMKSWRQRTQESITQHLDSYAHYLKDFINRLETGREFEVEPAKLLLALGEKRVNALGANRYLNRDLDLHDMLRTYQGDEDWINPVFGGLWVRFVEQNLGSDGVILIEGGDASNFIPAPTTVIYNLYVVKNQRIEILTA